MPQIVKMPDSSKQVEMGTQRQSDTVNSFLERERDIFKYIIKYYRNHIRFVPLLIRNN